MTADIRLQSIISYDRREAILRLLAGVAHLPGVIAELGVYRGGTLQQMAKLCPHKTCYGFDTFTGLPLSSWDRTVDVHVPGEFGETEYKVVRAGMPSNVTLRPGYFPETTHGLSVEICFAHVDMDLEKSTADAIEWLVPRMAQGGIIVFDDYEWPQCPGVKAAIDRSGLVVEPTGAQYQVMRIAL